MSREAKKRALEKFATVKELCDKHGDKINRKHVYGGALIEHFDVVCQALAQQPARPYRLLQDNGSKYFGDSWDKAEQPAQRKPLTPEWYAQWIRNNYQDYWNIATLCDEMTKAAHSVKEQP